MSASEIPGMVMKFRLVSILLIVAVIACPLRCGIGYCHAAGCCAVAEEAASPEYSAAVEQPGCCCPRSPLEEESEERSPCPERSSCQGVCGGAVIDKSTELNATLLCQCLPAFDFDGVAAARQAPVQILANAQRECCDGNRGRIVRTLHSSLLC